MGSPLKRLYGENAVKGFGGNQLHESNFNSIIKELLMLGVLNGALGDSFDFGNGVTGTVTRDANSNLITSIKLTVKQLTQKAPYYANSTKTSYNNVDVKKVDAAATAYALLRADGTVVDKTAYTLTAEGVVNFGSAQTAEFFMMDNLTYISEATITIQRDKFGVITAFGSDAVATTSTSDSGTSGGTITNVNSSAYVFNGTSAKSTATTSKVNSLGNWTIEMWVRVTNNKTAYVWQKGSNEIAGIWNATLVGNGGTVGGAMELYKANVDIRTGTSIGVDVDTWTHIAWAYDGGAGTITGYKNGQQVFQKTGIPAHNTGTGTTFTLGNDGGTANWFQAKMDEFRFWNVARTATEISGNYNKELADPATITSLMLYYQAEEGTGTVGKDSSANPTDLTHSNTTYDSADIPTLT